MNEKKILIVIATLFVIIIIPIFLIKFNLFGITDKIFLNLNKETKLILRTIKKNKSHGFGTFHILKNLVNDYNIKFLPETQYVDLDFYKKKIKLSGEFSKNYFQKSKLKRNIFYSFYLESYKDNILITDYLGNFYLIKTEEVLKKNNKNLNAEIIDSDLETFKVLDTLIYNNKIYISHANQPNKEEECYNFNISYSELNKHSFKFKNLFSSEECVKQNFYQTYGGRIKFYKHKEKNGILLTVGDDIINLTAENRKNDRAQNDKSIVGKIIFIDFDNKKHEIFSKGHRNPQGLFVDGSIILSTEHGPKGGDEINKIIYGENYGWPMASYGETYSWNSGESKKISDFKKSHSEFGYKEPIFSFVPSIGISEIVKVPDNFAKLWQDNFLVSSLYGHSLFRIKFDKDYNKILYNEKIFIGDRIRDLKFDQNAQALFLVLEESSEIGVIKLKQN